MENKSWCPVPWISTGVKPNGQLRVCCHANSSKSKGLHRKSDNTVYNLSVDDLNSARNSDLVKELRQAMLKGERHEMCIRCNREDDEGIRSRRQYERQIWENKFTIDDAKAVTFEDGSIDTEKTPIYHADIRFGNLCNLKCRMCGPTDSSTWYEEYFDIHGEYFHDTIGKIYLSKNEKGKVFAVNDPYNWHQKNEFWQQLESNIKNIEHLYLAGGEPFILDRHYDLLNKIVEAGRADQVIVEYNSNITNIPKRAWDIWKYFKAIKIGASVDGYGEVNNYIRYPSKWVAIEKNLEKLDNAEGNFEIWLAVTVQIYNIEHIPELIKWKMSKNFKHIGHTDLPFITPHPLHTPLHFNIKCLPKNVKDMIKLKYEEFYQWLDNHALLDLDNDERNRKISGLKKLLNGYINYMYSEDLPAEHLINFWNYTKQMDKYRNQNFEKVSPNMAYHIKQYLRVE